MSSVVVNETVQQVVIDEGETTQTVEITEQIVSVIEVGTQGPAGSDGANGQDGADGAGDKYYEYTLSGQTDVTVTHNLLKFPSITVFDSANDEVEGTYRFIDLNNVRLQFSAGFSGKAIFN